MDEKLFWKIKNDKEVKSRTKRSLPKPFHEEDSGQARMIEKISF